MTMLTVVRYRRAVHNSQLATDRMDDMALPDTTRQDTIDNARYLWTHGEKALALDIVIHDLDLSPTAARKILNGELS